jgi:hypothetical protein
MDALDDGLPGLFAYSCILSNTFLSASANLKHTPATKVFITKFRLNRNAERPAGTVGRYAVRGKRDVKRVYP